MTYEDLEISIYEGTTIQQVQEQFGNGFPFLRLYFFYRHPVQDNTSKVFSFPPSDWARPLSAIQKLKVFGDMKLTPNMRVEEVEKAFLDYFGVLVKVYRKAGTLWLETSMTPDWTLAQQNEEAKNIDIILKDSEDMENHDRFNT